MTQVLPTSLTVHRLRVDDLRLLQVQEAQWYIQTLSQDVETARILIHQGGAFSVFYDGLCLAVGGLMPKWEGVATAWAIMGSHARKHMLGLTRIVKANIDAHLEFRYHRIETSVQTEFPEGHRWVRMMGFEREGTMRGYGTQGFDCDLYSRINPQLLKVKR
jgi:hypothetical protein